MNFNPAFIIFALTAVFLAVCPAMAGDNATEPITITATGDGTYYLNEEIILSGTNTESGHTYLFMTGPTLNENGVRPDRPTTDAVTGDADTFDAVKVESDGTWEYWLDTSAIDLDAGSYTIYAVTEPKNKAYLSGISYNTVSITIKKPIISAKVSEKNVEKGEELTIKGSAIGEPDSVGIWVFGPDYWNGAESGSMVAVTPEEDGSFSYVIDQSETKNMETGKYYVIVQHPMYNDQFDVTANQNQDKDSVMVSKAYSSDQNSDDSFYITGSSALSGSDAAEALIEDLNSGVDDSYDMCTFYIEENSGNNTGNPTSGVFSALGSYIAGIFGMN
ncbi:hypothetical protein J2128_002295 [Methanomicrobium sp. W14]|uniref:hypothetical protein n=1 Tax=Methanomicrobium sp. W14 TaxID=2817839 RepID=UPI001AE755CD|nr:hypothetical protein [Methanomicrobium sp. W14]MBP2134329.1 hypothetical protein [Methanomicrobium sp. W14]